MRGYPFRKPKLFTLSISFFNEAPFQFPVSGQATQSVCHLLFQPLCQIGEVLADTGGQPVIVIHKQTGGLHGHEVVHEDVVGHDGEVAFLLDAEFLRHLSHRLFSARPGRSWL